VPGRRSATVVVLVAVFLTFCDIAGGSEKAGVLPIPRHDLRTATLPSGAQFDQIVVTPQGLLVSGVTSATAAEVTPTCISVTLNPRSLAAADRHVGSCNDPLLLGHTVAAINTPIPNSNNATLSIASANPATGEVTTGPIVMTYASLSDTRPVVAYGAEWFWVYDEATTKGPQLLQVSAASGAVVNVVAMPSLFRPLLAADSEGVWIANSLAGSPGPALSYVKAGSSSPTVIVSDTDLPICWLVAARTTAWVGAGIQRACVKEAVERFADEVQAPPSYSTATGFAAFTVIGDEADGLWTIQWESSPVPGQRDKAEVISIDPHTGRARVLGTLPAVVIQSYAEDEGLTQGEAVYFDTALYLLAPPLRQGAYTGYSSIVRVAVAHE